jgi:hypothetical protein
MFEPDLPGADRINPVEASYWWRQSSPAGAVLSKLMVLFIVVPVALVLKSFYILSFALFALMVPYGFFVRRLAVRAARQYVDEHPEERENFEKAGIIS